MAHYATALRRTLARSLSSQTRHFSRSSSRRSLSRPISNPKNPSPFPIPTRQSRPGSTRTHFRFISAAPEPESEKESLSASTASKVDEHDDDDDGDGEELSAPPKWANPECIDENTVLIDGCDFEHWLVIMGFPEHPKPSKEEMIQTYVSTVAEAVGSEEEAKKKIYSVSTGLYTGFGVALSHEVANTIKKQQNVQWVLPDSYIDVPSKDYGGDKYINGEIISRPEFQVPVRQDHWNYYSDDEYEKSPLDGFEYETTNHLDEHDKMYQQLREAIRASKKELISSDGSDVIREDSTKLVGKLKERMESLSQKNPDQCGTGSSIELSQALHELKGDMKRTKIEPSETQKKEYFGDSSREYFGNSAKDDPGKPIPDLDQFKEEVMLFREQYPDPPIDGGSKTHHSIFDRLKRRLETVKNESEPKVSDLEKFDGPMKRSPIERYSFVDEPADVEQLKSADGPKMC